METSVKKQSFLILILIATVVFAVLPASAQDKTLTADQQELVDYLQGVFDQFLGLSSYTSAGSQTVVQHITAKTKTAEVVVDQTIDQQLNGQVKRDEAGKLSMSAQIDQTINQVVGGKSQDLTQTIEMILIGDDFFMRFSDVTPATMAGVFPKDWVNLAKDPNAFPGASVINADQYADAFSGSFKYPLNADTVDKIKELPGETLDGVDTRVIKLVFNAPALFSSGAMDKVLSAFNFAQMGVDIDQLRKSMGENAALEVTLWIGANDDMVYRQDTAMTLAGDMGAIVAGVQSMNMEQQMTGSWTFSGFNEPVTIEAPKVK